MVKKQSIYVTVTFSYACVMCTPMRKQMHAVFLLSTSLTYRNAAILFEGTMVYFDVT